MNFQSATSANLAEAVFRQVVFGVTKTLTGTDVSARTLYLGEPVNLSTATIGVGASGQEVLRALTATNAVMNRLCVGPVASATIALESAGLVQVYGRATVRLAEVATIAVGDMLLPSVNSAATALAPYGGGCWAAQAYTTHTDLAGLNMIVSQGVSAIACAPATAATGTLVAGPYTNGVAFIRAM